MRVRDEFTTAFLKADDTWEAAAVCYKELLEYCPTADSRFVAAYIDSQVRYQEIEVFRTSVMALSTRIDAIDTQTLPISFYGFLQQTLDELCNMSVPSGLDEQLCGAVCMFHLIAICDSISQNDEEEIGHDRPSKLGPLNPTDEPGQFFVYISERNSILDNVYGHGRDSFRSPSESTRIGDQFTMFQFIMARDLVYGAGTPVIRSVNLTEAAYSRIITSKKLLLASVPGIGSSHIEFCNIEDEKEYSGSQSQNGVSPAQSEPRSLVVDDRLPCVNFFVKYPQSQQQSATQAMLQCLDTAVRSGANLIVLPEYMLGQEQLEAVRAYLYSLPYSEKPHLLAVFAGSSYVVDDKKHHNNITYIFDRNGQELGKYYKYSPYREFQSEYLRHRVPHPDPAIQQSGRYKCHEILTDKGNECTLLDIDGIGRVLPAICRDVIDREYTEILCKLFRPSLVVAPAYSSSVHSFITHFKSYAETLHISSLLCNACQAVENCKNDAQEGVRQIGSFIYPTKDDTEMKGSVLDIERTSSCQRNCTSSCGCVQMIEIDFSVENMLSCQVLQPLFSLPAYGE